MSIKPITDDITKRLLSAVKSRFGMTEEEIWKNSLILFAGSASNLKPGCNVEIVDASRNSSVVIELDCFTQIREANANAKQESPTLAERLSKLGHHIKQAQSRLTSKAQ